MIFKEQFTMQLKDIGKENYMKNRAILEIFENIGTHHSDIAGYGPNDIKRTGVTWVLLDWKVQVLKRPKYGEKLNSIIGLEVILDNICSNCGGTYKVPFRLTSEFFGPSIE